MTVHAPGHGGCFGSYTGHTITDTAVQVWVEVQHCEERVQLLCTITRAVETHVSILQDELCKVSAVSSCAMRCSSLFCPVSPR